MNNKLKGSEGLKRSMKRREDLRLARNCRGSFRRSAYPLNKYQVHPNCLDTRIVGST